MNEKRAVMIIKFSIFLSVLLIFWEVDVEHIPEVSRAPKGFWYAELVIACIMLADLIHSCVQAHRRPEHHRVEVEGLVPGTFHHAAASGRHQPVGLVAHIYSFEFWIDLASVVPFLISLGTPDEWYGLLRALGILRLLKLYHYSPATHLIVSELFHRRHQIRVVSGIALIVALLGSVGIYELEHVVQPDAFGTVADAMWWMIVTMTTVGYGDISPHTAEGKIFAMVLMPVSLGIMGAVIGIVGGAHQDVDLSEIEKFNDQ
jgi:hypothetical protein